MHTLRTLFAPLMGKQQTDASATSQPVGIWSVRVVWGVWFGMTAWLAVFVAKHGHNLPVNDEWAFVPTLYAGWREKLSWLFQLHCEHRFILGRLVYLGLMWVAGIDFRVGLWATFVFLTTAAAVLILAARKLRGHTHHVDIIFPLLVLHLGHTENLMMGYQLVFTLTALYLALFALLVAHSATLRPATTAMLGAALLVPISLGGGQGLAFIPALAFWVAWQVLRAFRTGGSWWRSFCAGLLLVTVACYTTAAVLEQLSHPSPEAIRNSPLETVRVAVQVFGLGIGPVGLTETPGVGWGVLAAEIVVGFALLVIAWRRTEEQPVALGLLAMLGGVFAFVLAVGHARDNGWCSRFAVFAMFGPVVIALALARYMGPSRRYTLWVSVVVALGVVTTAANAWHGTRMVITPDHTYRAFRMEQQLGVPIDLIAERHVRMWDFTRTGWYELWEHHFPLLEGVPGPYTGQILPGAFSPDTTPDPNQLLARKCYSISVPAEQSILAIRLVFRASARSTWEPSHFEWTDPETGQTKRTTGTSWVKTDRDETIPFIIRGRARDCRVFIGRTECPIEILRVEVLPMVK
jgi:hypothetical protein